MDRNEILENKKLVIIIIVVLVLAGAFCYFFLWKGEEIEVVEQTVGEIDETDKKQEEKINPDKLVVVHISGAVQNPGIVNLEEGERIADAIEKAGGATEEADLSKLNLAYVLEDGVKLRIPKKEEKLERGRRIC